MAKRNISDYISKYIDEAIDRAVEKSRITFSNELSPLYQEIRNLGARIEELKYRIEMIAETVSHLTVRLDRVEQELKEIRAVLETKVSYQDYYALNKRVEVLEEKVHKTS